MNEKFSIHIDYTHDHNKLIVEIDEHEAKRVHILSESFETVEKAFEGIIKFFSKEGFLK